MKQGSARALYKLSESLKELRVQQRVSYIVMFVLLAITAWIANQMIWQPLSTLQITKWQLINQVQGANESTSRIDISDLYTSHIFGQLSQSSPVTKQPKQQDAPKSPLNVVLVGVVINSEPDKNLAVITHNGRQTTYGINEVIKGTSAKLIDTQPDRVIIDNSGRNETVMLKGIKYNELSSSVNELPRASH